MKSLGSIRRAFAPWNDPVGQALYRLRKRHQALRRLHRRQQPFALDLRARVLRPARRVGLRQVHAAPDARRLRRADLGPHPARRAGSARHPALPASGQHDVPVLRAVSAHDGRGQHRLRPQAGGHAQGPTSRRGSRRCCAWSSSSSSPSASRTSSRAASASAWRSPARSPSGRRCCCSTSRSARSTRSCARRRSSS